MIDDVEISTERLVEICNIIMQAAFDNNIGPVELGKAIYALFITGCVGGNCDDASIDSIIIQIKKAIQDERDRQKKKIN